MGENDMTEREKMLAGELYDCGDPELLERWHLAKDLIKQYNALPSGDLKTKEAVLRQLLGGCGENVWITSPFYVDYGNNIFLGNHCEINLNCSLVRRFKFTRRSIRRIFENGLLCRGKRVSLLFAVRRRLR